MSDISMSLPRISTLAAAPPLQASRWQRLHVLLMPHELEKLLNDLGNPFLLLMGRFYSLEEFTRQREQFLTCYSQYITDLSHGSPIDEETYQQYFSAALSGDLDPLYLLEGAQATYLLRANLPIIQLQYHSFDYSPLDGQVRSMVYGQDTISWGLQFSYPQLYIDPKTKEICQTNSDLVANAALFKQLQRWVRRNTAPTHFVYAENSFYSSIRLGPGCLPWINKHPQLANHNLKIILQ